MEWKLFPGEWHLDAGVLALALALDFALRELPSRVHPVVWMGKLVLMVGTSGAFWPREGVPLCLGRWHGHTRSGGFRRTCMAVG